MKANDLRIGNLVTLNSPYWPQLQGKILEVMGIRKCKPIKDKENTDYSIQLIDRNDKFEQEYSQYLCFIEPIKITEDWLLRFGITPNIFRSRTLSYGNGDITLDLDFIVYKPKLYFKIEYVHQIQNIYFALTEEELVLQEFFLKM